MELRRLWHLVWHRKLLIVAFVIAALAAGYEATPRSAQYQATAMLFVGVPEYNSAAIFSSDLAQGQQEVAVTFATMLRSYGIAQAAVSSSGVDRSPGAVAGEISTAVVPGTSLITVSVTDPDPLTAQQLANAAAAAFVDQIRKIDPVTQTVGTATPAKAPVSVSQAASLPRVPMSNGLSHNLVLSGIFGLLIAVGLVLVLDYLDLSVRAPEDLERRAGLPVLGIIPLFPDLSKHDYTFQTSRPGTPAQLSGARDG